MIRGKVTTVGNWKKLPFLPIATFRTASQDGAAQTRYLASQYVQRVKEHIQDQDLPLKALSGMTSAKKTEHKYDWWIEEGEFEKALGVWESTGRTNKVRIFAGASDDIIHTGSGLTMFQLAQVLEFGSTKRNIPGRPLFGLTALEFRKEFREAMTKKTFQRAERYWARIT